MREERIACLQRDREGREPETEKQEKESSGREDIYSKGNLLSQSFSVFFWLLLRHRKTYDARRELSLSLSLSQTSCWQILPRDHFSSAMVCAMPVQGLTTGQSAQAVEMSRESPPCLSSHSALYLQEQSNGLSKGRTPPSDHSASLIRGTYAQAMAGVYLSHRASWSFIISSVLFTQALLSEDFKCYTNIFKVNILPLLIHFSLACVL